MAGSDLRPSAVSLHQMEIREGDMTADMGPWNCRLQTLGEIEHGNEKALDLCSVSAP